MPTKYYLVFGVWLHLLRYFHPKRIEGATIGEVLAALAEVLYGSQFGLGALLSGLVQGLEVNSAFLSPRIVMKVGFH